MVPHIVMSPDLICSIILVMTTLRDTTSHTPLTPWKSFKTSLTFMTIALCADAALAVAQVIVPVSHSWIIGIVMLEF